MQKRIGRPFTWTAMLTRRGSTFAQDMAAYSAEQRAAGVDVWPQVTCRPLTFQMNLKDPFTFNMRPAFKALMDTSMEERLAAYNDPAWRERRAVRARAREHGGPALGRDDDRRSARRRASSAAAVADVAAERGLEPLDAMIEISVTEDLEPRFRSTLANDDFDTIGDLLQQDGVLMGLSDAGAHVSQLCDACMPTDLLGNWVREREVLTLEHAVHKLTGEPAGVYGFEGRGVLAAGNHADVAVFDPDTISPGPVRRIRDFPADGERLVADRPSGMRHVLVNGTPIRVDGESDPEGLAAKPGTILRG